MFLLVTNLSDCCEWTAVINFSVILAEVLPVSTISFYKTDIYRSKVVPSHIAYISFITLSKLRNCLFCRVLLSNFLTQFCRMSPINHHVVVLKLNLVQNIFIRAVNLRTACLKLNVNDVIITEGRSREN